MPGSVHFELVGSGTETVTVAVGVGQTVVLDCDCWVMYNERERHRELKKVENYCPNKFYNFCFLKLF